ncbi:COG3650 family protein [Novosphingobium soli]
MPGDSADHRPWHGLRPDEQVRFVGTEPFWGGTAGPAGLTYSTPENQAGETVPASRFAGRGGLSFSGQLSSGPATLAITPGACSDGMSDYRYPFIVTLHIGGEMRRGCGWTDRQPRTGKSG